MITSKSMQITDPNLIRHQSLVESNSEQTISLARHVTHAAVGVILRDNGLVLLAERPVGKPWAGYWEFPGGKIEDNETPEQALKRELKEELGIAVIQLYPWLIRTYDYPAKHNNLTGELESPAKTVKLHFFIVTDWLGEPFGLEKQTLSWQNPEKLAVEPMLPANAPILKALGLSPLYAITNLNELGEDLFFERLKSALDHGLMIIQVREKQLSVEDLLLFAERVIEVAEPYEAKVLIHTYSNVAKQLNAAGVHLNSHDLMQLGSKPEGMLCGASCHNHEELAHAQVLGLDYVMLSPVQSTLSHIDAEPLGWEEFGRLITDYSLPVYALGGMQMADLHTARSYGAHGVAMLRNVWDERNLSVKT